MRTVTTIAAIVLGATAIVLFVFGVRQRVPRDATPDGMDRRRFLNRALIGSLSVFAVALGAGSIDVLWPKLRARFGSKINAGKREDILRTIDRDGKYYNVDGRFYLTRYDTSDPANAYVKAGVATAGLISLYQRCPHLGCKVPFCPTSRLFECPCHYARFNKAGEAASGSNALESMWHFAIAVDDSANVIVDTSQPRAQMPRGFLTVSAEPAGKFCISG